MWHWLITCIALALEAVPNIYVSSRKLRNLLSMMSFWITLRWFSLFSSYSSTHKPLYYRPPGPRLSLLSLRDHLSYRPKWTVRCEWITVSPHIWCPRDQFLCGFLWLSQGHFDIKILGKPALTYIWRIIPVIIIWWINIFIYHNYGFNIGYTPLSHYITASGPG